MANFALLWGLLGLFQSLLLPGLIGLRIAKLELPVLRAIVMACILSLLLNYVLILILVSLHFYTTTIMRTVVLAELVSLLYLLRHSLFQPITWRFPSAFSELYKTYPWLTVFAVLSILFYIDQALGQAGTIFTQWDAIVSWNHWAIEWSHNQFSAGTDHYPQLLPINFSIPYVLVAGPLPLQFFSKMLALTLPLLPLLAMLDLAISIKKPGYLLGLILIGLAYKLTYHDLVGSGYADIPASILGFIGLYALILAKKYPDAFLAYIFLGTLACAAAAVTKQAGCYIAIVYPLLTYFLYSREFDHSWQQRVLMALLQFVLLCTLILPWYLYNQWLINHGLNGTEIPFITHDIYGGIGYWHRLWDALREIKFALWFCLLFSFVYSFYNRHWRCCFIIVVVPYLLLWAFLFSYDLRNLSLIVPWIGYGAGLGLLALMTGPKSQSGVKAITGYLSQMHYFTLLIFASAILLAVSLGPLRYKNLVQYELQQEQQLGGEVGTWMYHYQSLYGLQGKIDTDWQYLAYLPGLNQFYYPDKLISVAILDQAMANPKIGYFLIIDDELNAAVNAKIAFLLAADRLDIIWRWDDMTFYKVNHE